MRIPSLLLIAGVLLAPPAASAATRVLEGATDAKAFKALRLDAHVGEVEVRVGTDERITWLVRIEPDDDAGWFSDRKDAQRAIDGAQVRAVAAGESWELELDLPRGTDFDDLEEHWQVTVPARFALEIDANVGRVDLAGVAGGVEAELNVGEMRIDVPQGRVEARVNVGELRIVSATRSAGALRLAANVGEVDLKLDGKRIEADSTFSLGGGVTMSNGGKDDISAHVNVGSVSVRVDSSSQAAP